MLKIFNNINTESFTLCNINNLYCETSEGGNKSIFFDISPKDEQYKLIAEEIRLEYKGLYYLIKKINERKAVSSIEAELDLDDFKATAYFEFNQTEVLLSELFNILLLDTGLINDGWTVTNANLISHRHTIDLTNCNALDIIGEMAKLWNCAFSFDNKNKVIDCIDLEAIQPSGVYFTDELNLKSIEFKGDSSDFCTRLICRGYKDENGDYITFSSINDGKNYVENYDYSDKVITKTWTDERYTEPQSLKDDAIEKLKTMAIPLRSYNCTLVDLSKVDSKYSDMGINLYDIIVLVDRQRGTRVKHRIVKLKEYDENPLNNVFTLSSIQSSITGTINQVQTLINNAGDIVVEGKTLNEFKRDINTNSLEIQNRYTKGETNTILDSVIQQSESNIIAQVSDSYYNKNETSNIISSTVEQTKDDITLDFKNGGLSTNVIFDSDGQKIYNGNFEIYNEPKNSLNNKKIFGTDEYGNLEMGGRLSNPDSCEKAEIGYNTEFYYNISNEGFFLFNNSDDNGYVVVDSEGNKHQIAYFTASHREGKTLLQGFNEIDFMVNNSNNDNFYYNPTLSVKPTGGKLGGLWNIEKIDIANDIAININNSTIGELTYDSTGYMTYNMHWWGVGIAIDDSYKIVANRTGGKLYGTWYGTNNIAITSDRNKKNTIKSVSDKYSIFFDKLVPVTFKYNDGTSNRLHTGFISQDVEQALIDSNISSDDFAGFVKDENGNYYLRYEEFIALNTNEIQKLKTKVDEQQTEIDKLKEITENQQKQIDELKQLINQNLSK